ncbi:hypothetical protein EVAR_81937_1 [Eumeta japonica]|uniref:RING-type domain-containing protein n=1 Tax=Eumeta variegata TaxID=151549 RepID=A0A4C1ZJ44_EUMVA|nr:hypothetical protein EVAR_81937_1 [Eumeta japonica]
MDYTCVDNLNEVFSNYVRQIQNYLNQLDELSNNCLVVDPVRPTYRDVYRKIVIGEGMWLHVEVSRRGEAANVHLIGGDDSQRERLDQGLLKWDHDLMIYQNIMNIFDCIVLHSTLCLTHLSSRSPVCLPVCLSTHPIMSGVVSRSRLCMDRPCRAAPPPECAICLCYELADSAPPAALRQPKCGLHFHRSCLYQWLVMSAHKQPHQFAARGSCPNCGAVVSVEPHD